MSDFDLLPHKSSQISTYRSGIRSRHFYLSKVPTSERKYLFGCKKLLCGANILAHEYLFVNEIMTKQKVCATEVTHTENQLSDTEILDDVVHILIASAREVDKNRAVLHGLGKLHTIGNCVR